MSYLLPSKTGDCGLCMCSVQCFIEGELGKRLDSFVFCVLFFVL